MPVRAPLGCTRRSLMPLLMPRYVILTNRKRAIVALVHSVAFLGIAFYGVISVVRPLGAASPASAWTVAGVYVVVTSALAVLAAISGNWCERLSFAVCPPSATFALLRQILGDPPMHCAVYVRIASGDRPESAAA